MDGHIYSRRTKAGKLRWYIAVRLPTGKRIRQVVGSREQAQAALGKLQAQVFTGQWLDGPPKRTLTMRDLVDQWLAHAQRKKSLADDTARLERAVEFFGEATLVNALRAADIDRYRDHLERAAPKTRGGERLSPTTVNHHLKVLRSACRLAVTRGDLERSPCQGVRLLVEDNERDRTVSPDELRRLMEAATPAMRAAIALGVETGLRLGNVAGLRWERIDLANAIATVPEVEVKTGVPLTVPLTPLAVEVLQALKPALEGPVFGHSAHRLSQMFHALCVRLDIRDLRYHDLRHTAATEVAAGGADILTLMRLFGWRSVGTAKRYVSHDVEQLRAAMDKRRRK